MNTFRRLHLYPGGADSSLDLRGPDTRRENDAPGSDLNSLVVLGVTHPRDVLVRGRCLEHVELRPRRDRGALCSRRAGHGQRVACVVDLYVPVDDPSTETRAIQVGKTFERTRPREMTMAGQPISRARREKVVEGHARAEVGPVEDRSTERKQKRNRPGQMRAKLLDQQTPLAERLGHQAEPELLQVAQAAVRETARAARGAAGEVVLLDEPDGQPTRCRIERTPGSDDPSAGHEDVENV